MDIKSIEKLRVIHKIFENARFAKMTSVAEMRQDV